MNDVELVEHVRAGRIQAFGTLVQRHQDRVYRICLRITGNHEDARDVTQESFLTAYQRLDQYRKESAFFTWLFRVAVNLAISFHRSRRRRPTTTLDDETLLETSQAARLRAQTEAAAGPTCDEQNELRRMALRAIHELDDDHRAVLVLRDMEGLDYLTIAEILEIAHGTVKSRLHRARAQVREALRPVLGKESGACSEGDPPD